jgi:hypothetical protein
MEEEVQTSETSEGNHLHTDTFFPSATHLMCGAVLHFLFHLYGMDMLL